ncbi:MAG: prenyltransferase [Deltaproteobacteria bacterium]|nr:prenyltransferase [Deltaproteobacteria bacterium]
MMNSYFKAMRLPFLAGSMVPAAVAGAYAWLRNEFELVSFLLAAFGVACLHVASNLINDWSDAPGTDRVNLRVTPFSGGSRVIQEGGVSRPTVLSMALAFFGIALLIGILLAAWRAPGVLWVGVLGLLAGCLYSIRPLELMSRSLGEITIFFAFGPLITLGMYYVMAGRLYWPAFWIGLPNAFLITAVIWINEFPDLEADQDTGKRNLVVVLGLQRSRTVYAALMQLPYPSLMALALAGVYSPGLLLGLLAFPLSLRAVQLVFAMDEDRRGIVHIQALTLQTLLVLGLAMVAGLILHGLLF